MKNKPNPGSPAAIKRGCECPVMDNNYGRGYTGDGKCFVYNAHCKVHQPKRKAKQEP